MHHFFVWFNKNRVPTEDAIMTKVGSCLRYLKGHTLQTNGPAWISPRQAPSVFLPIPLCPTFLFSKVVPLKSVVSTLSVFGIQPVGSVRNDGQHFMLWTAARATGKQCWPDLTSFLGTSSPDADGTPEDPTRWVTTLQSQHYRPPPRPFLTTIKPNLPPQSLLWRQKVVSPLPLSLVSF